MAAFPKFIAIVLLLGSLANIIISAGWLASLKVNPLSPLIHEIIGIILIVLVMLIVFKYQFVVPFKD